MDKIVRSLQRQLRFTQFAVGLSWGALGATIYGVHHLGERHHETFQELYQAHRGVSEGEGGFSAPCGQLPSPSAEQDSSEQSQKKETKSGSWPW